MCKKALFWFALAATLVVTTASSAFSAWLAKDFDIEGQVFPEDMLFQAAVSLTLFHDEDQAKSDPVLFSLWLGADISSLTDEDGRELEFEGPYTEGERGFDVFHMKVYLKEPPVSPGRGEADLPVQGDLRWRCLQPHQPYKQLSAPGELLVPEGGGGVCWWRAEPGSCPDVHYRTF